MKVLGTFGAALVCVAALGVTDAGTGDPEETSAARLPCAAPRVFAESQSWWKPAPGAPDTATDFGHVHLGACIPERGFCS